jgi:hypothetical protein
MVGASIRGEVPVQVLQNAKRNGPFIFLAVVVLLVSGSAIHSQQGHLIPPRPERQYPMKVDVLSSLPEGVRFKPYKSYLDHLYSDIQHNLVARLPESALNGEKGAVVVRVHIESDGSLPQGAVRIVFSCGKEDIDAAVQSAIRAAVSREEFPEGNVGAKLDLLFTFGFAPQEPTQKPGVVPVKTAVNHLCQT